MEPLEPVSIQRQPVPVQRRNLLCCRVVYGYPSLHGAVVSNRKSYGPVRCDFKKAEILLRCGSVLSSDIGNPTVRFGAVIYPTVRFGPVFRIRECYDAVRFGAVFRCREPYGAVRLCFLSYGAVRCRSVRFSNIVKPSVRFGFEEGKSPTVRFGAVNLTEPHRTDRKNRTLKNPAMLDVM